jgi:hypothetical protein
VVASAPALATKAGSSAAGVRAIGKETLLSGPGAERPLALAFVDDNRFLAVAPGQVELFRMGVAGAELLSRVPLPGSRHRVRAPAALIAPDASGSVAWVLSNEEMRAHLVSVDGDRLGLSADAEALPWPGSASGLRFRDGTDWIEGDVEGVGAGPFLAIAGEDGVVAVSTGGALVQEKADANRDEGLLTVGPMLAPLWPGVIATSTAQPPGASDSVVILERTRAAFEEVGSIPVEGAVRALAGRVVKDGVWLVAAVETGSRYEVLRLKLERVGT